jgi:hypothetical protein
MDRRQHQPDASAPMKRRIVRHSLFFEVNNNAVSWRREP